MRMLTRSSSLLGCLVTILVIGSMLAGCGNRESEEVFSSPSPSPVFRPTSLPTATHTITVTLEPTIQPTPTPSVLGLDYDFNLDLKAGPVEVPFELQIPSLEVNAPVLGVGLIMGNVMDAPKGPARDPVWHTAFWYRGSGIPGEPGTATFGGHVNNSVGEREIFGHLRKLKPGDRIIIHLKNTTTDILFYVDQVKTYSEEESTDPAVLAQIFGEGPTTGAGPQPSLDGLSHLTLITCAGEMVDGIFNAHTVVYATRAE